MSKISSRTLRVPAFLTSSGTQITFWCAFCDIWHYHGAGDNPAKPLYGPRVAHCLSFESPYKQHGVLLVDQAKLMKTKSGGRRWKP